MFDAEALRERRQQWARFNEWEARHAPKLHDLASAWSWYEEMWEAALQTGAIPAVPRVDPDKVHHINVVLDKLARLPWPR